MANKTLHALLVAIDNYPIPRHQLNGCVNDRNAFKEYLENRYVGESLDTNILTLTDHEATKKGIIDGFQHFKNAKEGDICVFYFSGHGSQAPAPKEFWHLDPDQMNESVVCYDSRVKGGKDLMDKELSYLFWEASNEKELHFLTVFDCCHSGTITRKINVTPRMAEPSPTPSRLEDYFGFEHYQKTVTDGALSVTPPSANIIQLGASKAYETAKELKINNQSRGIFTYSLIEALEQYAGQLTYKDLIHVLKIRIANRVPQQTPQLNVKSADLLKSSFLNTTLQADKPYFLVQHEQNKWQINAGSIHGIPQSGGTVELTDGSTAELHSVMATRSLVSGMENRDKNKVFRAYSKSIVYPNLRVGLAPHGEEDGLELVKTTIETYQPERIQLEEEIENAQYWIRAEDGTLKLTMPEDERPLFKRVSGYTQDNATDFMHSIEAVAKWKNLLELSNPKSTILDHEFQIELFRTTEIGNLEDSGYAELIDWKDDPTFRYGYAHNAWHQPAFRLKVKNTSFRKLYFSAITLSDNYGISNQFMRLEELEPGQEAWLLDAVGSLTYKTIPLAVHDAFHSWGITEVNSYVKVFVSNDPKLDTDGFNQDGLAYDEKTTTRSFGRKKPPTKQLDWTARELKFTTVRPMEKIVLAANDSVKLLDQFTIESPNGLNATAQLTSLGDTQRALTNASNSIQKLNYHSISTRGVMAPFEIKEGKTSNTSLSVLELKEVDGSESVTADTPLIIRPNQQFQEDETVVPFGFDEETGLLLPLGFMTDEGEIQIAALPEPTADNERSLGGSIKIFFQKIFLSKLAGGYNYPQIAIPVFPEEGESFEYEKDLDTIKAKVTEAQKIALFIHGIIGDTTEMPKALRRGNDSNGALLENQFDLVLTFDYENLNTPIEDTGKALGEKLASIGLEEGHNKHLTIIAHSMGGLVSRWFIEKEGGNNVVNHLIQLGTPNMGTPITNLYEMVSLLIARVVNGASFLQPYLIPLSFLGRYVKKLFHTLQQMDHDGTDLLNGLNNNDDPGTVYTIIAGNTQLIPIELEEKYNTLLKKLIARLKKRGHYDALDLLLFKKPNDIAVSVDSILGIPGKANRAYPPTEYEVPCDHLGYFGNPESLEALAKAIESNFQEPPIQA